MIRVVMLGVASSLLLGCSSPMHTLSDGAEQIQIRTDAGFDASQCQWLGDATGSEGFWFNAWIYPNHVLIQGAVNQLKNQALAHGGDTITIDYSNYFQTSVTMLGSLYRCQPIAGEL
ncbi:DUF4156 domain-containing protein [Vibrio sp. HDW18]|uniref:DUF4156 domain-containing protein n=1 Tax=Vibrio sp. HDW18 TaxID=2714948 RepID=UPI0014098A5D|nr:DUF4156 domain-containing protein [Vibrio sp. HDW18]QIL84854.1 DUF4156 domain-containing protein [Vibrio sp. HDW18]